MASKEPGFEATVTTLPATPTLNLNVPHCPSEELPLARFTFHGALFPSLPSQAKQRRRFEAAHVRKLFSLRNAISGHLVALRSRAKPLARRNVLVSSSTVASQMGVVDGRVHRDRRCGSCIRIALMINHLLKFVDRDLHLIHDDVIVHWTSSALDGNVGGKVKIPHERVRDLLLHQRARKGIAISVTLLRVRKESNVMPFGRDYDREFGHGHLCSILLKPTLDFRNFDPKNLGKLVFGHAIAE